METFSEAKYQQETNKRKRIVALVAFAVVGGLAIYQEVENAKNNRQNIGNVTCEGSIPADIQTGTTIDEIVESQKNKMVYSLNPEELSNLKSIIISRVPEKNLKEDVHDGGSELIITQSVTVDLPAKCQIS